MLIVDKKDALDIVSGTLPVVRGGTGVATSTGTGNVVLNASPTLVTPNIGVATGTSFNSITGLSSVVGTTSGTAAVGTSTTAARADHVHPIQTTITGNSSTTTALQTARTLTIGSTGKTFDGTANVSWSVAEIGAQPVDADLTAISALASTSGLLKKTAADTWTLDTSSYVTSSGVTSVTGTAPIVSSGGNTPAISINAATTSAAGSMSATDKVKLDDIAVGAQVNVATNLGITAGTTAGPIVTSSTGTNATLPTASASASGVVTTGNQTWAGVKTFSSNPISSAAQSTATNALTRKDYVDNALASKANQSTTYTKTEIDSVNLLMADKYLAAQNIVNMEYTDGNLSKIQYNNPTDVNYEIFNYSGGNLASIQHYTEGVLRGTTTLSYTSGNLVSAIFVGV